ncbi:GTPase [Oxalobacteraceae bacterium R-40]|uniref:GTPase n=1 Tax=Keguizhuia sedimenti TaxID=3064264 RepID=A0ABU1BJS9_9BURK|nr:GTPase [Oxalobacteraceae bacterium R-40]
MTPVTLVLGSSGIQREKTIANLVDPACPTVVLLEGFPDGKAVLENAGNSSTLKIIRVAAGCMCCTGNLVLKVTLNRILRDPPKQIFLSVADASHIEKLHHFLTSPPYDKLLFLTKDCRT